MNSHIGHDLPVALVATCLQLDTSPDDAKVRLQSYISGCYGTLTSFNVLFADEEDQFKGSGGD